MSHIPSTTAVHTGLFPFGTVVGANDACTDAVLSVGQVADGRLHVFPGESRHKGISGGEFGIHWLVLIL